MIFLFYYYFYFFCHGYYCKWWLDPPACFVLNVAYGGSPSSSTTSRAVTISTRDCTTTSPVRFVRFRSAVANPADSFVPHALLIFAHASVIIRIRTVSLRFRSFLDKTPSEVIRSWLHLLSLDIHATERSLRLDFIAGFQARIRKCQKKVMVPLETPHSLDIFVYRGETHPF